MKTRGGPPGSLNFRLLRMTELSYTLSAELSSTTELLTTRGVQNSRLLMNSRLLLIVKSYWTLVYQTTELSSTSSTELSSTNLLNSRLPTYWTLVYQNYWTFVYQIGCMITNQMFQSTSSLEKPMRYRVERELESHTCQMNSRLPEDRTLVYQKLRF